MKHNQEDQEVQEVSSWSEKKICIKQKLYSYSLTGKFGWHFCQPWLAFLPTNLGMGANTIMTIVLYCQ